MSPKEASHQQALRLRQAGNSYGEIWSVLGIPKSTQSCWFKNLKLNPDAQDILRRKQGNGLKALALCNQHRTHRIQNENEKSRNTFETHVQNINDRDLMLIGASLYWAEGQKTFNAKQGEYPFIRFSNSDPQMVILFLKFLKKILAIPKNKIRGEIYIQPNLSPHDSFTYWHSITGISKDNLKVYKALSQASKGKRPKNLLPYGTIHIRVKGRLQYFKIKGLIDGIIKASPHLTAIH